MRSLALSKANWLSSRKYCCKVPSSFAPRGDTGEVGSDIFHLITPLFLKKKKKKIKKGEVLVIIVFALWIIFFHFC